jgi:aldehyde dehydrogenase (NAD+)
VMAAAAKTLASVTLELGGKSPVIVGPDANLDQAADWITFGKFLNAGQVCISPDHLYVHSAVKDAFVARLTARIRHAYGEVAKSPNLARLVTPSHATRLKRLLEDATDKGARPILANGQDGQAMGPHLIEGQTSDMAIAREEIFGPILPIIAYDDLDPVIAAINAGDKPLALYIFDRDQARIARITDSTTSGAVGVNLTLVQFTHPNLPFGGVNSSGIGAAHGEHGFRAFSHERAVIRNRFLLLPLLFPPYGPRVQRLLALVKRVLG